MTRHGAELLHATHPRTTSTRPESSLLALVRRTLAKTVPTVLVGLCAALGGLLPALPAQAAESDPVTWSVTPADADGPDGRSWMELVADPGDEVHEYLAVRNLGEADATFRLSAQDGYFTETGRFNMLESGQTSVDAGTWVDLPDEVAVAAGATEVVPLTITVPADATPGDHAAGVAASVLSTGTGADGATLQVESRVGFRLMTRVTGELAPSLEVERIDAAYATDWNPFAPGDASVGVVVRNTGNTRLSVAPTVTVAGTAGTVPEERIELLPGDVRTIPSEVAGVWPTVVSPTVAELDAEVITPDGGTADKLETVHAETTLWSMPWPQLLVLLGAALLLAAILTDRRRRSRRMDRMLEAARAEGARAAAERPQAGESDA